MSEIIISSPLTWVEYATKYCHKIVKDKRSTMTFSALYVTEKVAVEYSETNYLRFPVFFCKEEAPWAFYRPRESETLLGRIDLCRRVHVAQVGLARLTWLSSVGNPVHNAVTFQWIRTHAHASTTAESPKKQSLERANRRKWRPGFGSCRPARRCRTIKEKTPIGNLDSEV